MSTFLEVQVPTEWLRRARSGDASAQRSIYAALGRPVYSLLRRLVLRPAVAEELAQEVFLEVLRNLGAYSGAGSFAGWVRSIAVSKALMHLRSPWHARLLPEDAQGAIADLAAPQSDGPECGSDLERALNALPDLARSIVWLHDVEGYTHAEIARLHDRTVSFSKSQLARAHAALRDALEPKTGDQPCTLASRN
ncbi:MAG TPA: RNA polymerase sigma factor [Steroidobacteraceae bacterium]|nr:RNA polymerase sigma factor [Steroidobacteraceae bacterium]